MLVIYGTNFKYHTFHIPHETCWQRFLCCVGFVLSYSLYSHLFSTAAGWVSALLWLYKLHSQSHTQL